MNQTKILLDKELIGTITDPASSGSQVNLAYSKLYEKYSPIIKAFINKLVQSIDKYDKEEIHALTMCKALTYLSKYRSEYPFLVWLKTIARNNVIDYLRKKKLPTIPIENIEIENNNSPDIILQDKETNSLIQKFIMEQKETFQEILRFRFSGMSCRKISSKLGIPLGTVSTILFRSRILLKKSGVFEDNIMQTKI